MKNFLNLLLVMVAVFSFSFTAIAETTIKTDASASINITQTKASPVAAAAVANSPGDSESLNALSVAKSINTDDTGAIQPTNNQISNRQRRATIDYISPPSHRTNFDKTIIDRPDKRLQNRTFIAQLHRQFVTRV